MPHADCFTVLCAVPVETVSKYPPVVLWMMYYFPATLDQKLLSNSGSFVVLPNVQAS